MYRLRDLLLLLPGTGRNYGLQDEGGDEAAR
jgi:hypothetical protein